MSEIGWDNKTKDFPGGSVVKNLPANAGDAKDMGSVPGLERSPGGGHGNPLQYSCQENPMDRGDWQTTVQEVAKSWTWLKWLSMHTIKQNGQNIDNYWQWVVCIWEFTKLFSLLWDIVEVFYNMKFFESVMESAGRSIGPGVDLISRRSAGLVRGGAGWKQGVESLWNLLIVGNREPGGNLPWMEAPKESPGRLNGQMCAPLKPGCQGWGVQTGVGEGGQALSDVSSPHSPFLPSSLEPLPTWGPTSMPSSWLVLTFFTPTSPSSSLILEISFCTSGWPGLDVHQTDTRLLNAAWLHTG